MKKILVSVFVFSILLPTLAFASFDTSLKYGSKGSAVNDLQDFLVSQGFLKGKVDGSFGLVTLNAVKAFQSANGLSSDGYFGKASRAKANDVLATILQPSNTAEQAETGTITNTSNQPILDSRGCSSTSLFSSTTGQPCSSTTQPTTPNLPAGCTSTSGYSITTGQACNGLVATVQQLQQTVQQQAQTIQQIQQNTQQIAQNTTPTDVCPNISGNQSSIPSGMILQDGNCITPTPITPPAPQASIQIFETIGSNPNYFKPTTSRKGIDPVSFAIKSFDASGKQVDSPITVTTNDPDLPATFIIQPNAGFYVGKHDGNPQADCASDNHDCIPQSVGTFNFTFTNPQLNASKSIQLIVTDFQMPTSGPVSVKFLSSQSNYSQNIVPSENTYARMTFNVSPIADNIGAMINEMKFSVTDNTISSIKIYDGGGINGDVTAVPVNGIVDFSRLNIGAGPFPSGYNITVGIYYLPVGTDGLTSGTQSTATLIYYKTVGGYGSNEQNISIPTPTMTLVSSL